MRITSIYPGATIRRASDDPDADPLKVGDEIGPSEAVRVTGGPRLPARAYEVDESNERRIGSMRIG